VTTGGGAAADEDGGADVGEAELAAAELGAVESGEDVEAACDDAMPDEAASGVHVQTSWPVASVDWLSDATAPSINASVGQTKHEGGEGAAEDEGCAGGALEAAGALVTPAGALEAGDGGAPTLELLTGTGAGAGRETPAPGGGGPLL
jgi:hypothetical protein